MHREVAGEAVESNRQVEEQVQLLRPVHLGGQLGDFGPLVKSTSEGAR